ncbi:hypothetical protein ABVK25_006122 [Lepraria finkii]|uniref:Uncharacterized protein n=1 Tax=Lepraria finkii TaxID=1340010 RepID=A0ABR4B6I3_9LECA
MTICLHLSLLTSLFYASTSNSTTTGVTLTTPHPSNSTFPQHPTSPPPYPCFPISRHFTTPRPFFLDCTAAILLLPDSVALGIFHTSGPIDDYSLPIQKTSGTCRVIVDLVSVVAEEKGS